VSLFLTIDQIINHHLTRKFEGDEGVGIGVSRLFCVDDVYTTS